MLTQIKKPKQHFSTYYHDNSLLVQFILSEFIATHQLFCQIKDLTETALESAQSLQSLFESLNRLIGLVYDNERFMIFQWTKGPLTKLNHYCKQFYKNAHYQNKHNLALYNYVHKTWLSVLQIWEFLHAFQVTQMPKSAISKIKRTIKYLNTCISQMAKYISRIIPPFNNDENVIFFFFRRKTQLEEIYGIDFIDKVFKMSANESLQLLIQRYVQRGFDHLISSIHSA